MLTNPVRYLPQASVRSTSKLGAARRFHAEADRQDRLQLVVLCEAGGLPRTLWSNYPEFPDSCLRYPFHFPDEALQVFLCRQAWCWP